MGVIHIQRAGQIPLREKAARCQRSEAVVRHDQVIVDGNAQETAGFHKLAGNADVFSGGLQVVTWVVMG